MMRREGHRSWKVAFLTAGLIFITACSSLPEQVASLEQARSLVREVESHPLANQAAATRLESARNAIQSADAAYENDAPLEIIEHRAYIAQRNAQIAQQQVEEAAARQALQQGEAERNRVLLEARERETQVLAGEAEQARAMARERGLEAAAQSSQAQTAQQRAAALQQRVDELEAEETARGLVITLESVLFATGESDLSPGAATTLQQIATFMQEYPERRIRIEGHTDSRGSDALNLELSRARAQTVADALTELQVDPGRIEVIGLGKDFPIAPNETTAGMQQNRRVEVLFSDENGAFPVGSERRASIR